MKKIRQLLLHRYTMIGLFVLLVSGLLAGWLAWKTGINLASLKEVWTVTQAYLTKNPWALFLALVILPGLPVPTSLLMLTAGVVWREQPVMACGLCMLALALNFTWTYWLAAGPARRLVEKLLTATSLKIPVKS